MLNESLLKFEITKTELENAKVIANNDFKEVNKQIELIQHSEKNSTTHWLALEKKIKFVNGNNK
eukprot:Pgem_evm1s13992